MHSGPEQRYYIHEDHSSPVKSIFISGLKRVSIACKEDIVNALEFGASNRTVGKTEMNERSSRSHAIFTIQMDQRRVSDGQQRRSKLHLVDLAGSERNKRTMAIGKRFQESVRINQGLLALGNVISLLSKSKSKSIFIPYRQSILTRLLQDSLGGNSKTIFIACVSPSTDSIGETLNTLKYATRAMRILNSAVVNIQTVATNHHQQEFDKSIPVCLKYLFQATC